MKTLLAERGGKLYEHRLFNLYISCLIQVLHPRINRARTGTVDHPPSKTKTKRTQKLLGPRSPGGHLVPTTPALQKYLRINFANPCMKFNPSTHGPHMSGSAIYREMQRLSSRG